MRISFTFLGLLTSIMLHAQNTAPLPYGGMEAVRWLLADEMLFPAEDLAAGLNGDVVVGFVVRADGTVDNVGISRPLTPATEAEARRLVHLVRFEPASAAGRPADQPFSLTVPFHAKRYAKHAGRKDACARIDGPLPAAAGDTVFKTGLDSIAVPIVPRGLRGLGAHLGKNMRYPEEARKRDIQGNVSISFVVETSGIVTNLMLLEHLGAGCDEEARRLVRSLCWRPAIRNGQRVRSEVKLDIQFRLDNYQRP